MPKIEEINIEVNEKENLTYEIFIDKAISLIDKIYILIQQYNTIKDNTEILIDKIRNKINMINIEKEVPKKLNTDYKFNYTKIDKNKDIMKDIMNKLYILDAFLNNYIENFKTYISYNHLQIKELCKEDKYYNKEFFINYENEIKEIDKLISIYKEININDKTDDLFEHIINISNNYILTRKIILSINIIIKLGEILKNQNKKLKIIYEDLF